MVAACRLISQVASAFKCESPHIYRGEGGKVEGLLIAGQQICLLLPWFLFFVLQQQIFQWQATVAQIVGHPRRRLNTCTWNLISQAQPNCLTVCLAVWLFLCLSTLDLAAFYYSILSSLIYPASLALPSTRSQPTVSLIRPGLRLQHNPSYLFLQNYLLCLIADLQLQRLHSYFASSWA